MKIKKNLLVLALIISAQWTCLAQTKLVEYVDTKIGVIGTRASNCVIHHKDIAEGGVIEFELSEQGTNWGKENLL